MTLEDPLGISGNPGCPRNNLTLARRDLGRVNGPSVVSTTRSDHYRRDCPWEALAGRSKKMA